LPETASVAVLGDATKGDLNDDGCIDYCDLFEYSRCWVEHRTATGCSNLADFNNDQTIDAGDLLLFYGLWHDLGP